MPYVRKSAKPANPKKSAVLATASRPTRVAKRNARMTIRSATVPKSGVPRAPTDSRGVPNRTLPSASRHVSESPLGGESSDIDEASNDREALMGDIQRMIQGSIGEAFALRDGNFATGLPTAPVAGGHPAGTGNVPLPSPSLTSSFAMPQHVLSRWPWVSEDTIKSIATGNFEIDNLPKLHRSDDLRNAYLRRSMKGIYQPLDGGPAEIVVGTSKLHSSFRDPSTFFLAWQIYVSIRSEFKPAMGCRLAYWTERLHYFVQLNYSWPAILEYIIAYYQKYQDRTDDEAWFEPDSTLMDYHIILVQQKLQLPSGAPAAPPATATVKRNAQTGTRPRPSSQKLESMANEICITYNRASGCTWKDSEGGKCPRRHVCGTCLSSQHTISTCPSKVKTPK